MTTCTHRLPAGLHAHDLKRNHRTIARIRARAHRALGRWAYAWDRVDHWTRELERADGLTRLSYCRAKLKHWKAECKRRLPHPANTAPRAISSDSCRKYASTWDDETGFPRPSRGARLTYIWAVETTTGAESDRWHVHLHVLLPTRGEAEAYSAAWQLAREQRGLCSTDISGGPDRLIGSDGDDGGDRRDVAQYLTKYVAESVCDELEPQHVRAYIMGSKNLRRYDAGGAWRPLGIGRRSEEAADPLEWVHVGDGELEPIADFFSIGRTWHTWAARTREKRSRAALAATWAEEARELGGRVATYSAQYRTSLSLAVESDLDVYGALFCASSRPRSPD